MQKRKVTDVLFRFTTKAANPFKVIIPVLCVLLLFAAQITPLYAQLSTETSNSMATSAQVWNLTNDAGQTTTVIVQPFTNSGTFSETADSAGWWLLDSSGAQAFRFNIGGNIAHSSPGDTWTFVNFGGSGGGYQSLGTAEGTANGNFPYATYVSGTYTLTTTSPLGTVSGSGTWYGVLESGVPTSTSAPSTSSPTPTQPTFDRFLGSVALVKGPSWFTNTSVNVPLSSGQMGSGNTVLTGTNSIVSFTYPYQDGTVYLDGNTAAGWVGLTSEPAPDNQIAYFVVPSDAALPPIWGQDAKDMLISMPLEATLAVALFGELVGTAAAVALVVEGGVFLIHYGTAYINERNSHLVQVPQGVIAGENTKYVVNVSDGVTTVQVIDGPVYFIDPITNNTITVDTNQMLTLPPAGQSGFSEQDLQSDVSAFNSASINQWWTQSTPNALNGLANFLSVYQLIIIAVVVVAIIIAIAAVIVAKRRGTQLQQPGLPSTRSSARFAALNFTTER
ncbi:MAG: hypothetical protein ABSC20_02665 [Candidatus Bathyarchaeia archaeon]|jgi:hypothetical protein